MSLRLNVHDKLSVGCHVTLAHLEAASWRRIEALARSQGKLKIAEDAEVEASRIESLAAHLERLEEIDKQSAAANAEGGR